MKKTLSKEMMEKIKKSEGFKSISIVDCPDAEILSLDECIINDF